MKKIVFVIKNIQGNGAERFVLTLAKAMHDYHNAECHIICFENILEYNVPSIIKLHFFKINKSHAHKKNSVLLDAFILENIGKPDLVLSNLTYSDKILRYSTLDHVYHVIHSHTSIEHYQHRAFLSRWLAKVKLHKLYGIKPAVCVSKGVLTDFIQNIKPAQLPCLIYNPIDKCGVIESALATCDTLLPRQFILHVGKFNEAKRHDRLLRAYALANPEYDLVLLGKGHTMEACQQLAIDLGIHKKVHFLGQIKNPYPIMAKASLFVLASDFEGLPYVLLESISLGIPTISVDCPSGPREVFGDTYAHCLASMSDEALAIKINEALANPTMYRPVLAEQFSLVQAATEYLKLAKKM